MTSDHARATPPEAVPESVTPESVTPESRAATASAEAAAATAAGRAGHRHQLVTPGRMRTAGLVAVLAVAVIWVVPAYLGHYWTFLLTSAVVAVPIMQSLGVITGRVGVISLCQASFAMIGAWVVGWCNVAGIPGGFYVWMVLAGLATVPAGLVIGFPALRLRGANLAITTFAFATAVDVIFSSTPFPGSNSFNLVERPPGFASDGGYFLFAVIVVVVIFLLLAYIDRTRLGAAWIELRYSERGAAAHGTSVARTKLAAFAISAFIGGIAGALLVGQAGSTTPSAFSAQTSLFYFAIAVVIGVHYWDAALIAGFAGALMPTLLDKIHVPQAYVSVLFGVVAVFVLAKGKGQMGQADIMRARQQAKKVKQEGGGDLPRARSPRQGAETAPAGEETSGPSNVPASRGGDASAVDTTPALELRGITVTFGAVTAADDVSLSLPKGAVVALLGPNGAGKSTLINAATGFVPATGTALLDGKPLTGPPDRRARAGLRRSFQQLRVPPALTAGAFLTTAAGRSLSRDEIDEHLAWFGLPAAHVPVGTMDVGNRRMLEIAGLAASRSSVLLLDEPAAGQGVQETELLSGRITEIPRRTGSTVLLVEHDIDLVRAACDWLIVMDFGKVIASGEPETVLSDPAVLAAYVGTTTDHETEK